MLAHGLAAGQLNTEGREMRVGGGVGVGADRMTDQTPHLYKCY